MAEKSRKKEEKVKKNFKKVLQFEKEYGIIICVADQPAHRGIAQLVEYRSPKPWVAGSNPPAPAKKSKSKDLDFFICVRRTQHHLRACTQHHLSVSSTSLPPRAAQMNEVALRANDVLRNDVGYAQ